MLFTLPAAAEIYKWVDERGKVHYGDRLPDDARGVEIGGDANTVDHQRYDFLPAPETQPAAQEQVVMYATSWCGYCRQARNYFESRGIPYTEYDIEKNGSAKRRYDALGGRGVPLILVGDKRMAGFSRQRFERLYGAEPRPGRLSTGWAAAQPTPPHGW